MIRSNNHIIFFIFYLIFLIFFILRILLKLFSFPFQKSMIPAKWKFKIIIYGQEFVNNYLIGWNICHGIVFVKKNSFSCETFIDKAKFFRILTHVWLSLLEELFGEHYGECHREYLQGFTAFFFYSKLIAENYSSKLPLI